MKDFIKSGWFIVLLMSALVCYSVCNKLMWWTLFFVTLSAILGLLEFVCLRWTGYTLSEQFGQFYERKPVRGRWFFAVLLFVVTGLIAHLWAWGG